MTESGYGRSKKHAHEVSALTYGHFGKATYDATTQEWDFTRRILDRKIDINEDNESDTRVSHRRQLRLLHHCKKSLHELGAEHAYSSSDAPSSKRPALKWHPQAAFIAQKHLAEASQSHQSGSLLDNEQDPLEVPRVVIGQALLHAGRGIKSKGRNIQIAAFTNALLGHELHLCIVEDDSNSIGKGFATNLKNPTVVTEHTSRWAGSCESIEQISFAEATSYEYSIKTLGIRQKSSITILLPLVNERNHHPSASGLEQQHQYHEHCNMLNANPILRIQQTRTGGHDHAHFAFKPDDSRQICVIDTQGTWSIWKIKGLHALRSRPRYEASLGASSNLSQAIESNKATETQPVHTGWHKICWIGLTLTKVDHLLVVNRRQAAVFTSRGNFQGLIDMRLGHVRYGLQILDVQSCRNRFDLVVVLTSSCIMIMGGIDEESEMELSTNPEFLEMKVSWNHFYSLADVSLQMHILELDRDIIVILSSHRHPDARVYRFSWDEKSPKRVFSRADPCSLELLPAIVMADVQSLSFFIVNDVTPNSNLDSDNRVLIKLVAMTKNSNISEAVYECFRNSDRTGSEKAWPTININQPKLANSRSTFMVEYDSMDEFVVDDDESLSASASSPGVMENLPVNEYVDTSGIATIDLKWKHLRPNTTQLQYLDSDTERLSVENYLISAKHRLEQEEVPNSGNVRTLFGIPHIKDIEEDSSQLAHWLSSVSLLSPENAAPKNRTRKVGCYVSSSYANVHDDLVFDYVQSLPEHLPDRIRVQRERLCRQISAELYLSSHILTRRDVLDDAAAQRVDGDDNATGTEDKPAEPLSLEDLDLGLLRASTLAATPVSQSARDIAIQTLKRYTTIQYPSQTTSTTATTATQPSATSIPNTTTATTSKTIIHDILSHLPMSAITSPSDYSYTKTLSVQKYYVATQNLDARARRKAERAILAKQRKLDRLARLTKAVESEQASLLPDIVVSGLESGPSGGIGEGGGTGRGRDGAREVQSSQSRPVGARTGMLSGVGTGIGIGSSQSEMGAGGEAWVMTQPERGAFGVRPAGFLATTGMKGGKKKKKNRPGF